MLSVPLADAIAQPGAVVVVGGHALLASPAVSGAQRNIDEAYLAHPETKFDFARPIAPLDGR